MTESTDLGLGHQTFDVIWLFSVFTHLAPRDYVVMLKLLRRYARPDSRLFYTVFIDELTDGGFGFTDRMEAAMRRAGGPPTLEHIAADSVRKPKPFVDVYADQPLRCALYSRDYAHQLIEGTGWVPVDLLPPNQYAQHQFICSPV
jgi:hypothetical protein